MAIWVNRPAMTTAAAGHPAPAKSAATTAANSRMSIA
jgi:hypothetical protein